MKVPPIIFFGRRSILASPSSDTRVSTNYIPPLSDDYDKVSFSSNARYMKKYATLPDSIREVLSPRDGIDMLKDMELVACGRIKRQKIEDDYSTVYVNPWLSDYYMLVSKNSDDEICAISNERIVAEVIWEDNDNPNIRIIKKHHN